MKPSDVHIAVIVPTIGRETLPRAVASLVPAGLRAGDVVYIERDGPQSFHDPGHLTHIVESVGAGRRVSITTGGPTGDFGALARTRGLRSLDLVTHVAFLDDDDAYTIGALTAMREWAAEQPRSLHIARMVKANGEVAAWTKPEIMCGQVGTPMLLAPADVACEVAWEPIYDADWRWARDVAAQCDGVSWHGDVTAIVRPWEAR